MSRPHPRWLVPLALLVIGIAALIAGASAVVGGTVIAVAVVVAVSLAFLEVGYSEDRARERGEYGPPPTRRS